MLKEVMDIILLVCPHQEGGGGSEHLTLSVSLIQHFKWVKLRFQ